MNNTKHTQKQPMLRQNTDIAWFSSLYDSQPGNCVGLFFQPNPIRCLSIGACTGYTYLEGQLKTGNFSANHVN